MNKRLSYRAREIEAWVENHLVDSNGILYTFADRTTGKLLSNELLESVDPMRLPNSTTAGWWAYENCSMVTGAYMEAMLCRYEVEGDVSALARARRCFNGLRHIYELGKQLEEGFMPKIYDNRFTPDTSSDQVLFAMSALDHFHRHATPAEQTEISRMIGAMVRFFVKRDYKYTFYELQNMAWPLARFTAKNLMAYRHTGDDYFRKEYERLLALGVNERPGEEYLRPKLAGEVTPTETEKEVGGWILTIPLYCATMDLMELEYLLRHDASNAWAPK